MINQISGHTNIEYLIIQEFAFQSDILIAELVKRHIHAFTLLNRRKDSE
jgi:hypothetical protein